MSISTWAGHTVTSAWVERSESPCLNLFKLWCFQQPCFPCFSCEDGSRGETGNTGSPLWLLGTIRVNCSECEPEGTSLRKATNTEPQCQRTAQLRRNSSDPIEGKQKNSTFQHLLPVSSPPSFHWRHTLWMTGTFTHMESNHKKQLETLSNPLSVLLSPVLCRGAMCFVRNTLAKLDLLFQLFIKLNILNVFASCLFLVNEKQSQKKSVCHTETLILLHSDCLICHSPGDSATGRVSTESRPLPPLLRPSLRVKSKYQVSDYRNFFFCDTGLNITANFPYAPR